LTVTISDEILREIKMSGSEYELTDSEIRTAFYRAVVVVPMFDEVRRENSSAKRLEKRELTLEEMRSTMRDIKVDLNSKNVKKYKRIIQKHQELSKSIKGTVVVAITAPTIKRAGVTDVTSQVTGRTTAR